MYSNLSFSSIFLKESDTLNYTATQISGWTCTRMPAPRAKGQAAAATPRIWSQQEINLIMLGTHESSINGTRWYETKHELENLTNDDLDALFLSTPDAFLAYSHFFAMTINRLNNACAKGGEFAGKKTLVASALARKTRLMEMGQYMRNKKHQKELLSKEPGGQTKKSLFKQGQICSYLCIKPSE